MSAPYVSVGMPVYNGERFLPRAIETMLAQDFADFELVISDNGSTDGTAEVCRAYAALDRRVRVERHERNRGASWNFNRVLALADPRSRYFKWAAADDEHAPAYLSRTVRILDADPTVVLAHTGTADIDEEGYLLRVWHQQVSNLEHPDPARRLLDLVGEWHECFQVFGLMRHHVARATRGLGAYADSDHVLLVEVALRGRFVQDDEVLFHRRQHAERSMASYLYARDQVAWFDPGRAGRVTFPAWRLGAETLRAVRRAPLSPAQRGRCYAALTAFVRQTWPDLVKNVARSAVEAGAGVTGGRPWSDPAGRTLP